MATKYFSVRNDKTAAEAADEAADGRLYIATDDKSLVYEGEKLNALDDKTAAKIADTATALTAETKARTAADAAINQQIAKTVDSLTAADTEEANARVEADSTLQGYITAEATARQAGDDEIKKTINGLKENEIKSSLHDVGAESDDDQTLGLRLYRNNGTSERKIIPAVDEYANGLMTPSHLAQLNQATADIASEATNRANTDTTLTNKISSEVASRNSKIEELMRRLQGKSSNSDASTDPFVWIGEYSNFEQVFKAIENAHDIGSSKTPGEYRFTVTGLNYRCQYYIVSYGGRSAVQVVSGVLKINDGKLSNTFVDAYNVAVRTITGGVAGSWKLVNQNLMDSVSSLDTQVQAVATTSTSSQSRITALEAKVGTDCPIGSNYETLNDDDPTTLEEAILHLKRLKAVVKTLVDSLDTAGVIKRS